MHDWLSPFIGDQVVIDTDAGYLAIGRLAEVGPDHLVLADCDLHDHAEANSTKEIYCLDSLRFGPRTNRRAVTLPRTRLVAISRLADVHG